MKVKNLKRVIGTQYLNAYPERRNIINIVPYTEYKEVTDIFRKIINFKLYLRRYTKLKKLLGNLIYQTTKERYSFYLPNKIEEIDFYHFFNTLNFKAKQPWGVTFETSLPAYHAVSLFHKGHFKDGNKKALKGINRYLKVLADDKCKFIIAISQCAFNIQKSILELYPQYKNIILDKTFILHPPQRILINSIDEKAESDIVNFMYVGTEFLGKGGLEILHVFEEIKDLYQNFHLYLVGNFNRESSCTKNVTDVQIENLKNIIKNNSDKITYFESLPNNELLDLIKTKIQVGLLPTRGDTYGYSVLEFQAAGCPVISTNLRALPEINNNDCGWLIEVDKNKFGETYHFNLEDLNKLQKQIENQLKPIIKNILENPNCILPKAKKAVERIKKEHSFESYSNKLTQVYNEFI
jgi:glycosyltransferase involved in cell wall biosynthesis